MNVVDISNDICHTREQEHILALEAIVGELREEIRLLKSNKPTIIEVPPKDMVSLETYNKLQQLYLDLCDETMAF
jgi:vacuolar-type H+-ATPase subunit F/Vma7